MKLIPRRRRPIRSVRSGPVQRRTAALDLERNTPVTMDKRGGMARDVRELEGQVLGLGSRFRVPKLATDDIPSGPGSQTRRYRVSVVSKNVAHRALGLPMLRLEVDFEHQGQGQAYRVIEPCTTRFRMRSKAQREDPPDPRFHLAGRGGPQVMLDGDPSDEDDRG